MSPSIVSGRVVATVGGVRIPRPVVECDRAFRCARGTRPAMWRFAVGHEGHQFTIAMVAIDQPSSYRRTKNVGERRAERVSSRVKRSRRPVAEARAGPLVLDLGAVLLLSTFQLPRETSRGQVEGRRSRVWSVPGRHHLRRMRRGQVAGKPERVEALIRFQRTRMSCSVFTSACHMCRRPVARSAADDESRTSAARGSDDRSEDPPLSRSRRKPSRSRRGVASGEFFFHGC